MASVAAPILFFVRQTFLKYYLSEATMSGKLWKKVFFQPKTKFGDLAFVHRPCPDFLKKIVAINTDPLPRLLQ